MLRIYAVAAVIAVVAGLSATWYFGQSKADAFAACSASTAGADIGGPFELVNQNGQTMTDQDVFTEPSLVYFGYTFCPDMCPLDVAKTADAVDLLQEQGISAQPVFITIDPERDTVDVMSDYAENMHDRMIALTGTPEQVDVASKAYRTYYNARKDGTDEYLVDHSTFTYLVLPEQGFVEFFRNNVTTEDMASRTACFVNNA